MSNEPSPIERGNGKPARRPLQTAVNGRQARGQFAAGNRFGRGNGISRKVARFRTSMFAAVKAGDVRAIVVKLLEEAKAGESWAVVPRGMLTLSNVSKPWRPCFRRK